MSKTESPQTKVGGSVGDTPEAEFDSVDGLVHHGLAEVELKAREGWVVNSLLNTERGYGRVCAALTSSDSS